MKKKNIVKLKPEDLASLNKIISRGSQKARTITRCRILLMSNERKTDTQIIKSLHTARNTIRTVRSRYVRKGLGAAIYEQQRPGAPVKFTGRDKAKVTAIACSKPPGGRDRWTLRLIADKMVELDMVEEISHQTVKRILKKTNCVLT